MKHELYSTGDKGVPSSIVDGNGEVTLALCKVCGGAESTLEKDCPGRRIKNKPVITTEK